MLNNVVKEKKIGDVEELLIVVDMVNGFVRFGNMYSPRIGRIVPVIENLARTFEENPKGKVAFVKEAHTERAKEFLRFAVHCVKGTLEAEVIDELKGFLRNALIYEKNSVEASSHKIMRTIKRMKSLNKIVIVGCCTDICVKNLAIALKNALEDADIDIEVVVPENAVETFDSDQHNAKEWTDMTFKFMELNGVNVVKKYEKKRGE